MIFCTCTRTPCASNVFVNGVVPVQRLAMLPFCGVRSTTSGFDIGCSRVCVVQWFCASQYWLEPTTSVTV